MSKRFQEITWKILTSVYYMKKPSKITHEVQNISADNLAQAIVFLENKKLIVTDLPNVPTKINLTDRGIEFVVNELDRRAQREFNRMIAFTGAILALIGIYKFISDLGLINEDTYWIRYIFLIFAIIAIGPIIAFIIDSYFGGLK